MSFTSDGVYFCENGLDQLTGGFFFMDQVDEICVVYKYMFTNITIRGNQN